MRVIDGGGGWLSLWMERRGEGVVEEELTQVSVGVVWPHMGRWG